jgi:G:T-mismatch repair DNA endonuclease (very short patch repair protein)
MGWKYLVIWECELGDLPKLAREIRSFLGRK